MSDVASINRDVWLPFGEAYRTGRLDLLDGILAAEFVRVEGTAGWIGDREQYLARTRDGFDTASRRGDSLAIEFRFTDRLVGDGLAHDSGVYRVTIAGGDGEVRDFYGRFDTTLRSTPDGWRLILDHDTNDGVGPKEFEDARHMDAV